MKSKTIKPAKKLSGRITVPGDKSISHRAVMLGAISEGRTIVYNLLDCDDCDHTIRAFREMGISIKRRWPAAIIEGKGLNGLERPKGPIDVGNSGTTMRVLAGILAGQDFKSTLKGDESLSDRPMKRVVDPLSQMGVRIKARNGEFPPLEIIGGKVRPIRYRMGVASAQVKSAVLFAGLYAKGLTTVEERLKSRDHTERMMKYFGADLKVDGLKISLKGPSELSGRKLEIPGDISSASFYIAGALLVKGSRIRIDRVGINPTRAGILSVLSKMGARVKILNRRDLFEPTGDIVAESGPTKGIVIERAAIPGIIDELPIIFVLAALSRGRTVIKGAGELRVKETDRISSMKHNLEMMGARLYLENDEIIIEGVRSLDGSNLKSFGDHRTCMAMAVAALAARGESRIDDAECVVKSFPGFFDVLEKIAK